MGFFSYITMMCISVFYIFYEVNCKYYINVLSIGNYFLILILSLFFRAVASIQLNGVINPDFAGAFIISHSKFGIKVSFLHYINSLLTNILGNSSIPFTMLYSLFGLIGSCFLFRTIILLGVKRRLPFLLIVIIFFLPSQLIFVSVLSKESILFPIFSYVIYKVVKDGFHTFCNPFVISSLAIALMIRPYIIVIISITYVLFMLKSDYSVIRKAVLLTLILPLTTLMSIILKVYQVKDFSLSSAQTLAATNQVNMAHANSTFASQSASSGNFFLHLPLSVFNNLFYPLFNASSLSMLLSSLENIGSLILFVVFFFYLKKYPNLLSSLNVKRRYLYFIFSFIVSNILLLSMNNSNAGYAIRCRSTFIIFLYSLFFLLIINRSYIRRR